MPTTTFVRPLTRTMSTTTSSRFIGQMMAIRSLGAWSKTHCPSILSLLPKQSVVRRPLASTCWFSTTAADLVESDDTGTSFTLSRKHVRNCAIIGKSNDINFQK